MNTYLKKVGSSNKKNIVTAEEFISWADEDQNTRTFTNKKELAEALMRGEKWTFGRGKIYYKFDEKMAQPFVIGCSYSGFEPMKSTWLEADGKTLWHRVEDKPMVTMPDGTKLPEPAREPLKLNKTYWIVTFEFQEDGVFYTGTITEYVWRDTAYDRLWLRHGFIRKTKEDAQKWSDYLLKLTGGKR